MKHRDRETERPDHISPIPQLQKMLVKPPFRHSQGLTAQKQVLMTSEIQFCRHKRLQKWAENITAPGKYRRW